MPTSTVEKDWRTQQYGQLDSGVSCTVYEAFQEVRGAFITPNNVNQTTGSNGKLAVIIPAYKQEFFAECLESIASQSCKYFTLYIGDDASPHNLAEIVNPFRSRINLVYHRFEENIGAKDLVGQWERCINLSQGEEWIWMFSDDDLMSPDCVKAFFESLTPQTADIVRFNVCVLSDGDAKIVRFPERLNAIEFLKMGCEGTIQSYAVEYIFRRDKFYDVGGFQRFDLAWGSDFATWAKIADNADIVTLSQGGVSWRRSDINITQKNDIGIMRRKVRAVGEYVVWQNEFTDNRYWMLANKRFVNQMQLACSVFGLRELAGEIVAYFRITNSVSYLLINSIVIPLYYMYVRIRKHVFWRNL